MNKIFLGDALFELNKIKNGSVDFVLVDPPYGTTKFNWDLIIPFEDMWKQIDLKLKDNGACCVFGQEPFSSLLRASNIKNYRYDWYWNKKKAANILSANKMPLKVIETISVFYKKQPDYNPQKILNPKGIEKRNQYKIKMSKTKETKNTIDSSGKKFLKYSSHYEPDKLNPKTLLSFSKPHKPVHPTQKPIELLEYLIKTYTIEGETVLDFTMGSGSTGVACKNINRKFIGIEKEKKYYEIAKQRIKEKK